MIKNMFPWLNGLPQIGLPMQISDLTMKTLATTITSAKYVWTSSSLPMVADKGASSGTEIFIVADQSSTEAISTALVLKSVLLPFVAHDPKLVPHILAKGEKLTSSAKTIVFICSQVSLKDAFFLSALLDAAVLMAAALPAICEEGFQFPSAAFYDELRNSPPASLQRGQVGQLRDVIQQLFSEFASFFQPQQLSMANLKVRATDMFTRLQRAELPKLSIKAKTEIEDAEDTFHI